MNKLVKSNIIGFYGKCEIDILFLKRKSDKSTFNLFTRVVFFDTEYTGTVPRYSKFNKIGNRFELKHVVYQHTIDYACEIFEKLRNENIFESLGSKLEIANKLELIGPEFTPPRQCFFPEIPINYVLNDTESNSGSYVLEFADIEKENLQDIFNEKERKTLNKIYNQLLENSAITFNLKATPERLGNIIFQIPVNILSFYRTKDCNLFINWNKKVKKKPKCILIFHRGEDNYGINSKAMFLRNNFINFKERIAPERVLVKMASNDFVIGISHNCRVFNAGRGANVKFIKTTRLFNNVRENFGLLEISLPNEEESTFEKLQRKARDEKSKQELEDELIFRQYKFDDPKEQSVLDIRKLINKYGQNGVYLWDPYISSKEILDTIYYHQFVTPKKVISSFKAYDNRFQVESCDRVEEGEIDDDINLTRRQQWLSINRDMLNQVRNEHGWSVEFRCKIGQKGWSFHDRFIIFPCDESPRVWALGKSIGHHSKDHHILQEVIFPERILNAFNELWEQLDDEDCKVYPYQSAGT